MAMPIILYVFLLLFRCLPILAGCTKRVSRNGGPSWEIHKKSAMPLMDKPLELLIVRIVLELRLVNLSMFVSKSPIDTFMYLFIMESSLMILLITNNGEVHEGSIM